MPRNTAVPMFHPAFLTRAPERASLQLEPPHADLRLRADPFDNPRWEISMRPDDLEDETDD